MTTINSSEKDANTSFRRAEREQSKHEGAVIKLLFDDLNKQIKADNIKAVYSYNEYLKTLLSIHKQCNQSVNWTSFSKDAHSKLPVRESLRQFEAEYNYQTYEPTFIDYVLLQKNNKVRELLDQVDVAIQEDDLIYNTVLKKFAADAADWKKMQAIATGIKLADPEAFVKAIEFFDPFIFISQLGAIIKNEVFSDYMVVNIHTNDIVPQYVLSETDSHTLSSRKMDVSTYNELLQDFICKATIRLARETFALLPLSFVIINILAEVLDTVNNHMEKRTIFSVKFDAEQFKQLSFENLNCAKAISGFLHHIKFTNAAGFCAVEMLNK